MILFPACQAFGQQARGAPSIPNAAQPSAAQSPAIPRPLRYWPELLAPDPWETLQRPAVSPFPYRFSLVPGLIPKALEKPAAPAFPVPFRDWHELLAPAAWKSAGHRLEAAADRCVIPLLRLPLPEHFDDGMLSRQGPNAVDKAMVWAPPPDCPLQR
jgi:hypothetical protein